MIEKLSIRRINLADTNAVVELWTSCDLVVPWNDPRRDIERKLKDSAELFFVGEIRKTIIATCMAGYDGHRGWIYYLAVDPKFRRRGIGAKLMQHAEQILRDQDCPKIDLMVRNSNQSTIKFYQRIGYKTDPVSVLSKRLVSDE